MKREIFTVLPVIAMLGVSLSVYSQDASDGEISIFSSPAGSRLNSGLKERGSFIHKRGGKKVENSLSDHLPRQEIFHLAVLYLYQNIDLDSLRSLVDISDDEFNTILPAIREYFFSALQADTRKSRLICDTYREAASENFARISRDDVVAEGERLKRQEDPGAERQQMLASFEASVLQRTNPDVLRQLNLYVEVYGDNFFYMNDADERNQDEDMGVNKIALIEATCK